MPKSGNHIEVLSTAMRREEDHESGYARRHLRLHDRENRLRNSHIGTHAPAAERNLALGSEPPQSVDVAGACGGDDGERRRWCCPRAGRTRCLRRLERVASSLKRSGGST